MVEFGIALPTCREGLFYSYGFAVKENMVGLTKEAERLGFDFVSGNDHYTSPRYLVQNPNFYEPLITFSYLAAVTKKIKFNTGVLVLPIRNIVVAAKQIATLDVLSEGRLTVGVGIGAYKEEFERSGGRGNRGQIIEEQLRALVSLLKDPKASFSGKYVNFSDMEMFPKPVQQPFPVWISKQSPEVLKRVGEIGEGWEPAGLSPERIEAGRKKINEYALKSGRDPSNIAICLECSLYLDKDIEAAENGFKKASTHLVHHIRTIDVDYEKTEKELPNFELEKWRMVGTPESIIKNIDEYKKAGVTHIFFDILGSDLSEITNQMKLFSREVLPYFL